MGSTSRASNPFCSPAKSHSLLLRDFLCLQLPNICGLTGLSYTGASQLPASVPPCPPGPSSVLGGSHSFSLFIFLLITGSNSPPRPCSPNLDFTLSEYPFKLASLALEFSLCHHYQQPVCLLSSVCTERLACRHRMPPHPGVWKEAQVWFLSTDTYELLWYF